AEVDRIQQSLGIAPAARQAGPPDSSGGYLIGHAAQVFAFGRDSVARVVYPFGTRQEDWAHDLPRLLAANYDSTSTPASPPTSAGSLGARPDLAIAPAVVAAAPDGMSGAMYLNILNSAERPDTLRAASVIGGPMATLHITTTRGGSATMQQIPWLEIPARGRLEMRPGGPHIMLEGAPQPLRPGTAAAVELHFAQRGRVTGLASIVTYAQLDSVLALARASLDAR
ncbi:MAG: copper chaperone PCu(A)C, partial [Gemmatimonadaceae bacterium]